MIIDWIFQVRNLPEVYQSYQYRESISMVSIT